MVPNMSAHGCICILAKIKCTYCSPATSVQLCRVFHILHSSLLPKKLTLQRIPVFRTSGPEQQFQPQNIWPTVLHTSELPVMKQVNPEHMRHKTDVRNRLLLHSHCFMHCSSPARRQGFPFYVDLIRLNILAQTDRKQRHRGQVRSCAVQLR